MENEPPISDLFGDRYGENSTSASKYFRHAPQSQKARVPLGIVNDEERREAANREQAGRPTEAQNKSSLDKAGTCLLTLDPKAMQVSV